MDELMKQAEDHLAKGRVQIATDGAVLGIKQDERAQFEDWMRTGEMDEDPNLDLTEDGFYEEFNVQRAWRGWQARAALSSNAAQSAGQEQLCWVPEDELPESMPSDAYNTLYPHSRVDIIREFPIYGPHPSSAAQVEEIRNSAQALIDVALEGAEDNVHVCDRNNDEAKLATLYPEVRALYRALKTAAPSKGEES